MEFKQDGTDKVSSGLWLLFLSFLPLLAVSFPLLTLLRLDALVALGSLPRWAQFFPSSDRL
jgi:hypothetical protein